MGKIPFFEGFLELALVETYDFPSGPKTWYLGVRYRETENHIVSST